MKNIKIPNNAYYFSIDIQENRPHYSVLVPSMEVVAKKDNYYGDMYLFNILDECPNANDFDQTLSCMLNVAEQNVPERTFLSITFYDEALNAVADYEACSRDNYYCFDLETNIKNAIRDFIRCIANGKQLENIDDCPCESSTTV